MAQQDIEAEGWPLGLLQPPNNARVIELARSGNNSESGSISFNTLLTCSSTDYNNSSSDLDTESTGSFFVDNSTTLGNLMGVSTISRRRAPNNKTEQDLKKINKQNKNRLSFIISWLLSSRRRNINPEEANNKNKKTNNDATSLAHYLAVERTSNNPIFYYGPHHVAEPNSLFVNGTIAPPQTNKKKRFSSSLSKLFSCVCGQSLA
ncbi:hypothetical protein PIB30_024881 [Stylosanthes scabra]|uniref:Uncharacterized protein n=1 Tax=Stylosanthes scabra TaxID=79078 RepID=A0ABU6RA57_9FABA|nr:hypothetical protein [Stylosanthes scabra]